MQLHVSGAFEFLENQFVHTTAGLGEGSGENRKTASFFHIARAPEKFLWLDQCLRFDTARHDPPLVRLQIIIAARKPRQTIEQNHDVFLHLDQTFGAFEHELCDLHVALHVLVEIGMVNLAINLPRKIGHFFRPLVDEQQNQNDLGMIHPDRLGDFLEQNRFPDAWRSYDQSALAAAKRREKIDTASTDRVRLRIFEHDPALRELRSQFFEIGGFFPLLRRLAFNREDIIEDKAFLAVAREPQFAAKFLAGAQTIELDRGAGDINVFRHRHEIQLRITQQSERVADLIEKTFGRNRGTLPERGARDIENGMVPRARWMEMQIKIARDPQKILSVFELIDAEPFRDRQRDGLSRTAGCLFCSLFYVVHFSWRQSSATIAACDASADLTPLFQTT